MPKAVRKCQGKNKEGKPCGAVPLKKGTVIEGVRASGKFCSTHDPSLPDSARIQGPQPHAGAPRKPRVVDVLRELIEDELRPQIEAAYRDALEATRPVVVGNGAHASLEFADDYNVRLKAAEALNDRAYGKPRQQVDVGGVDEPGAPIRVTLPDSDERAAEVAQILARTGAVVVAGIPAPEKVSANGHANGGDPDAAE